MLKKLRNIDIKFRNINLINANDILFPHLWQVKYNKNTDENFKEKNSKNIRVRIEIFKVLIKYINDTERFNGEYGE